MVTVVRYQIFQIFMEFIRGISLNHPFSNNFWELTKFSEFFRWRYFYKIFFFKKFRNVLIFGVTDAKKEQRSWTPHRFNKKSKKGNVFQGDVQTCVSVLLVLGEKSKELIDLNLQKLWFLDYIGKRYFTLLGITKVFPCCFDLRQGPRYPIGDNSNNDDDDTKIMATTRRQSFSNL